MGAKLLELFTFQIDSDPQLRLVSDEKVDTADQQNSKADGDERW